MGVEPMDMISIIVWVGVAAVPLAVLSGWLIGPGQRPLGALIHGRDAWWRSTMPWPQGVQEEYDVRWGVPETDQSPAGSGAAMTSETFSGALPVEPVGAKVRLRGR
jgi:hypothetical protein